MKTYQHKNVSYDQNCARGKLALGGKKPHESRPDWTICYATPKSQAWQSDYSGITRLAATGEYFWVNVWERAGDLFEPRGFALSIKPKDSPGKPARGLLRTTTDHPERYTGRLQLGGLCYAVTLWPDNEPPQYLSIHFAPERSVEP
jgi:hypothetical protein